MTPLWHLTRHSIANRRLSAALTVAAVALAVAMLLGVERLRHDARAGFEQTISGTDLVVGARSGPLQLLLYAVFHMGSATNNVSWEAVEALSAHPRVAWLVPLSLGDSHRGFRVVGTNSAFFEHYRHGHDQALVFSAGQAFGGLFEAVIGAEVAAQLGYRVGDSVVVSHGSGEVSFIDHGDKPFSVAGVLARTGTPIDRAVLVSLEAIEAIHVDWQGGAPLPGVRIGPEHVTKFDLTPKSVTAALVGLKSRTAVFAVQRYVNDYPKEPLLAVLPGATLQELWGLMAVAERAMLVVSALVVVVGLAGLVAVVVAGLGERRRELAILRALGASPPQILALVALESALLSVIGCVLGVALLMAASTVAGPWLQAQYGLHLSAGLPAAGEWLLLGGVLGAALCASLVPAVRAYRYSLADGMTIRV